MMPERGSMLVVRENNADFETIITLFPACEQIKVPHYHPAYDDVIQAIDDSTEGSEDRQRSFLPEWAWDKNNKCYLADRGSYDSLFNQLRSMVYQG